MQNTCIVLFTHVGHELCHPRTDPNLHIQSSRHLPSNAALPFELPVVYRKQVHSRRVGVVIAICWATGAIVGLVPVFGCIVTRHHLDNATLQKSYLWNTWCTSCFSDFY